MDFFLLIKADSNVTHWLPAAVKPRRNRSGIAAPPRPDGNQGGAKKTSSVAVMQCFVCHLLLDLIRKLEEDGNLRSKQSTPTTGACQTCLCVTSSVFRDFLPMQSSKLKMLSFKSTKLSSATAAHTLGEF